VERGGKEMSEEITKRQSFKKGLTIFKTIIVLLFIFSIVCLYCFFLPHNIPHPHKQAKRVVCLNNMKSLGIALKTYAHDNSNSYPTPDKWCDLLISEVKVSRKSSPIEDYLRCPGAKEGKCHYAMNPNCKPNSPRDTVLLFETKGGWNLSGATELLTTENHSGKGCCILFNNGSYEFIEKDKFPNLKWNTEKK
jgi:hypothetical protein